MPVLTALMFIPKLLYLFKNIFNDFLYNLAVKTILLNPDDFRKLIYTKEFLYFELLPEFSIFLTNDPSLEPLPPHSIIGCLFSFLSFQVELISEIWRKFFFEL